MTMILSGVHYHCVTNGVACKESRDISALRDCGRLVKPFVFVQEWISPKKSAALCSGTDFSKEVGFSLFRIGLLQRSWLLFVQERTSPKKSASLCSGMDFSKVRSEVPSAKTIAILGRLGGGAVRKSDVFCFPRQRMA